jgi:hypothetical protein
MGIERVYPESQGIRRINEFELHHIETSAGILCEKVDSMTQRIEFNIDIGYSEVDFDNS